MLWSWSQGIGSVGWHPCPPSTSAPRLASSLRALVDIASVSGDEAAIADAVQAALSPHRHLEITRDGDAVVARTNLGRDRRVVIAGHLDTVPINGNLPCATRWRRCCGVGARST